MAFNSETLLSRLAELAEGIDGPCRYLVAFSGGIDSTVLLHALHSSAGKHALPLLALHINHGLHADADHWEAHCRGVAQSLSVGFVSEQVDVDVDSGLGLEASARKARYDAFRRLVEDGDWLLSAHHEDDQAETMLLNLMRGSGPAGIAGIGARQSFGRGTLVRPMLGISSNSIVAYAEANGLKWIDDPSNLDPRFDRNFLRQEIIPVLEQRWPGVAQRLGRSAELAGEASELLNDLARFDLAAVSSGPGTDKLDVDGLKSLSKKRQRNLLRYAVRLCGLPPPPSTRLHQVIDELIAAREDAQPLVGWPGAEIRRYRNNLYLLAELPQRAASFPERLVADGNWLSLGPGGGQIRLEPGVVGGIDAAAVGSGLSLRYRQGGEEFRPAGREGTRKLKKLLQEDGIVPWMRQRIPLLYAGDELVAVGDLWVAASAASPDGYGVRWRGRPSLH